ncbi:MAG: hypothetical protein B6D45_00235 [Ignavibacteriales bacterium UTCHB3]|nr:MAG: hypothetical protein B6D45_00235 [Ignavibacteriales bacterium UTCHB3]
MMNLLLNRNSVYLRRKFVKKGSSFFVFFNTIDCVNCPDLIFIFDNISSECSSTHETGRNPGAILWKMPVW